VPGTELARLGKKKVLGPYEGAGRGAPLTRCREKTEKPELSRGNRTADDARMTPPVKKKKSPTSTVMRRPKEGIYSGRVEPCRPRLLKQGRSSTHVKITRPRKKGSSFSKEKGSAPACGGREAHSSRISLTKRRYVLKCSFHIKTKSFKTQNEVSTIPGQSLRKVYRTTGGEIKPFVGLLEGVNAFKNRRSSDISGRENSREIGGDPAVKVRSRPFVMAKKSPRAERPSERVLGEGRGSHSNGAGRKNQGRVVPEIIASRLRNFRLQLCGLGEYSVRHHR